MSFIALYIDHTGKQAGEFIRMRSDTSTCVVFLDVITLNIMAIVSLVNSARNYPRFLKCLNTLQKYDYALRVKTKDQKIRRRVIFTVLLTTIFIVLCTIFFMSEYNNFAIYIPSLTLHCSQAAILLHFTHLCTVITQRFKVINDKIEKEITNSRSEIGRKIISKTKLDAGCSSSVQHFKFLTDLYWQLCLAVHQANTFYSSQLLAAMLSAFSHATIFLYYFIRNFRPEPVSNETMKAIILLLMVVIYNAHLVVILKSSTELTKTSSGQKVDGPSAHKIESALNFMNSGSTYDVLHRTTEKYLCSARH
ncbi:hypothetical protein J6590_054630 [Homalodisca vitripennis]|nr:hypothetical protein J6590_054630 [Homalodisca vitripennis]